MEQQVTLVEQPDIELIVSRATEFPGDIRGS